jgi:hypothetical protein
MYGVIDSSGNQSLNGLHFQTHWTDTITSPPKLAPWSETTFDIVQILFATFYFTF